MQLAPGAAAYSCTGITPRKLLLNAVDVIEVVSGVKRDQVYISGIICASYR